MSYSEIGNAGAARLGEAIKHLSSLWRLDVSYNEISDAGAARLGEAMKHLYSLNWGGNEISEAGAASLGGPWPP